VCSVPSRLKRPSAERADLALAGELAKYHTPKAITPKPEIIPANTLGLHRVMFAVDDIEDTLARLRPHGGELVGEVTGYEGSYLLCYLRGPSGIILALAEQLS
jgi:catechol 2,3-dioxygenase-like lactoylglutathione lyase family enzyme